MKSLPWFAMLFSAFVLLPANGHAENETAFDAARFTIESPSPIPFSHDAAPGSLRVQLADFMLIAGGVKEAPDWESIQRAEPLDTATILRPMETGWEEIAVSIPEAVAWPAVAVDGASLYVIGGIRTVDTGGPAVSAKVSKWQYLSGEWTVEELPSLPSPVMLAGARVMDGILYLAGGTGPDGDLEQLMRLDLAYPDSGWRAEKIAGLESPLLQPLLEVRRDEVAIRNALILFGGWRLDPSGKGWKPATKALKYVPGKTAYPLVTPLKESPSDLLLYTASAVGPSHILAVGVSAEEVSAYPALTPRPAYPRSELLRYHVFTDTWTNFAADMPGTVTFIEWRTKKAINLTMADASGKESFLPAEIVATERHFSFFDYLVMVLYMFGLVAIGKYFASREKGTEDFFLGGRRVPWWAAGLSIYATGTSAISFMAIPAKTYATDWLYFIGMSLFPFFTVTIAAFVFIPLLRKLEITTVMEYFEMRFGRPVRLLMSAIAVLGQVAGRMSITLLLPSIALTAVTGMNIYVCILIMGVLATIYTAVGGINAVIWTDVLQVLVLFGGAILSFALIAMKVDGGLTAMFSLAVEDDKFHLLDLSWDFTTATLWIMVLWAVSDVFGKGLGQEGLQRAFSTRGVKEARRSMITCAVVALPAGFLFYGIGTALYAFYHAHPELLNPTLQTDAIFPLFIAQQLPVGIAGLVISGLFAASMSTLDTAMNTSATILVRDFYSIWRKDKGDREQLIVAKGITIVCGIFGTGMALYLASFENLGSLWDMFSILLGVIGGGLGGVGVLALCTTRANTWGTLAGAAVTAVCIVLIKQYTPIHFFIYGTLSMAIGSVTGYLFSLVLPGEKKDLTGLTLWTPAR